MHMRWRLEVPRLFPGVLNHGWIFASGTGHRAGCDYHLNVVTHSVYQSPFKVHDFENIRGACSVRFGAIRETVRLKGQPFI